MKNIIYLCFLLFIVFKSFSQNPNSTRYEKQLKISLAHYDMNAIQDTLFRENVAKAFSHVIFSNSDLATNSSAFGYSQNKEKTTIAINSNFRIGNVESPWYLSAGANATGSNNVFEFYSDGSWNNNVGLNLGIIRRIGNPSVFYTGKKEKRELINKKREIQARELIYNELKYNDGVKKKIIKLKKDILTISSNNDLLKDYKTTLELLPNIKKLLTEKKYDEAYAELEKEEKKIEKFLSIINSEEKLKKYIENNILYNFDKKNDITYGYSLMWIDLNLNFSNSTYNFDNDNIDSAIIEDFNNTFELNEDINKLKTVLSLNFNHTHNGEKTVWYYKFGINGTFGSFLENSLINGAPKIIQNENSNFIIQDEDEQNFGLYNNIEKTLAFGTLNAYGAIFFTEKKNFGFNISAQHEFLIKKPGNTYYENNFTTLFGPIFRKIKDDQTSLTFGIDVGWENSIYGNDVTNDFTGRIRVGIPFNIFSKKKE